MTEQAKRMDNKSWRKEDFVAMPEKSDNGKEDGENQKSEGERKEVSGQELQSIPTKYPYTLEWDVTGTGLTGMERAKQASKHIKNKRRWRHLSTLSSNAS